jgi:hypothetical protein
VLDAVWIRLARQETIERHEPDDDVNVLDAVWIRLARQETIESHEPDDDNELDAVWIRLARRETIERHNRLTRAMPTYVLTPIINA